ncbi:MAG TPA: replication initiator [Mycobacterium sp.]
MVRRASGPSFDTWWRRAESVGFCAQPIQLTGTDPAGRQQAVWTRCNNRRTSVCPSCADLYARDTWQLVHAGAAGGHHDVPVEVASRPQVFATLTAPSCGAVHNGTGAACHARQRRGAARRCIHGRPLHCGTTHAADDPLVGQPLCGQCYDYLGHVLFTWYMPELWRRFTIALRRAVAAQLRTVGAPRGSALVSFVKVVELQARAIPHIHALIRLDPPGGITGPGDQNRHGPAAAEGGGGEQSSEIRGGSWVSPINAGDLAALVQRVATQVRFDAVVEDCAGGGDRVMVRELRFGAQVDTQPLVADAAGAGSAAAGRLSPRRVAAYLAKYVTKSLHDFGITARRLSAQTIGELDVTDHIRAVLSTIAELADRTAAEGPLAGIGRWLHTLGYRGHITTKSRRYSTTMGALRAARATWTRDAFMKCQVTGDDIQSPAGGDLVLWEFGHSGHASAGDRVLAVSAALRHIQARIVGLAESRASNRESEQ